MASEIVVTSVPRGVFAGTTGFQVVMRTATLSKDVTETLAGLAVYRHLPQGAGSNPERLFHQFVQTAAGRLWVLGRVVDAGSDYSNRSNKLAHLVAVEESELGRLRSSSPAAVLRHIAPRLSRTWTSGPEQRQHPFDLAGMPPVTPRVCAGWRRVVGDPGWAGVLAERAQQGQPTLVINADSSPAACQQMLDLFEEALALLPPASRWGVTFDTSIMSAAPVLWRGTYAGSPESSQRQPGVLVMDLGRQSPVPAEFQASSLVKIAREGSVDPAQSAGEPRATQRAADPTTLSGVGAAARGDVSPADALTSPGDGTPRPATRASKAAESHAYVDDDEPAAQPRSPWFWPVVIASAVAVVSVGVSGLLFIGWWGLDRWQDRQASGRVAAWTEVRDGTPGKNAVAPTVDDWRRVWRQAADAAAGEEGVSREQVSAAEKPFVDRLPPLLPLLNSALLTADVTQETLATKAGIARLVAAVAEIRDGVPTAQDFEAVGVVLGDGDAKERADVAGLVAAVLARERAVGKSLVSIADLEPLAQGVAAIVSLAYRFDDTSAAITADVLQRVLGDTTDARAEKIVGLMNNVRTTRDVVSTLAGLSGLAASLDAVVQGTAKASDYRAIGLPVPEEKNKAEKVVASWNELAKQKGVTVTIADLEAQRKADQDAERRAADERKIIHQRQKAAWTELRSVLGMGQETPWPGAGKARQIATLKEGSANDLAAAVEVRAGQLEEWPTKVTKKKPGGTAAGVTEWLLSGLPGEPEQPWGTLRIKGSNGGEGPAELWFEAANDAPRSSGAVPIVLAMKGAEGIPPWFRFEPQLIDWAEGPTLLALVSPSVGKPAEATLRAKAWPKELVAVSGSCAVALQRSKSSPLQMLFQPEDDGTLVLKYEDQIDVDGQPKRLRLLEDFTWSADAATGAISLRCVEAGWRERSTRWGMSSQLSVPSSLSIDQSTWFALVSAVVRNRIGDEKTKACDLRLRVGLSVPSNEELRKLLRARLVQMTADRKRKEADLEKLESDLTQQQKAIAGAAEGLKKQKPPPPEEVIKEKVREQQQGLANAVAPARAKLKAAIASSQAAEIKLEQKIATLTNSEEELARMVAWPKVPANFVKPRSAVGPAGWLQEPGDFLADPESCLAKSLAEEGRNAKDVRQAVDDVEFLHRYRRERRAYFDEAAAQEWSGLADASREQNQAQNECLAIHMLADVEGVLLAQVRRQELEKAFDVPLSSLLDATVSLLWSAAGFTEPLPVPAVILHGKSQLVGEGPGQQPIPPGNPPTEKR